MLELGHGDHVVVIVVEVGEGDSVLLEVGVEEREIAHGVHIPVVDEQEGLLFEVG